MIEDITKMSSDWIFIKKIQDELINPKIYSGIPIKI